MWLCVYTCALCKRVKDVSPLKPKNQEIAIPWWLRWWRICLQCRRAGFDPWVGKILGEGNGYPLQYSGLENSMDYTVDGIRHDWGTCTFTFVAQMVQNLPAMQETGVQSQGQEDLLEKGMATRFSILVWGIPWTEEPGRLQSMELQKVWHNWATNTFQLCLQHLLTNICWKTSVCQVHTNEVCEKNPVHLYSRN